MAPSRVSIIFVCCNNKQELLRRYCSNVDRGAKIIIFRGGGGAILRKIAFFVTSSKINPDGTALNACDMVAGVIVHVRRVDILQTPNFKSCKLM